MRKLSYLCMLFVLVVSVSLGQSLNYGYSAPFPDTTGALLRIGILNNGIAVDPAGKVWIAPYDRSSSSFVKGLDSIFNGTTYPKVAPVYVFNPNGTQASFSPIKILSAGGQTDTLLGTSATAGRLGYGGGINAANGNFIGLWGSLTYKPGALIYEINYKTGAGVTRILNPPGLGANSPASIGVDKDGLLYLSGVLGGIPGQILNPDGSAATTFAASVPAIGRAMAVSADGKDVYCPRFTGLLTYIYHSDNGSLGPYTLKDSILLGASSEAIAIHPKTGYVWISADYRSSKDSTVYHRKWTPNMFYAYNPVTKALVDSFKVKQWPDTGAVLPLPRGIAFSPSGDTVYLAHFDGSTYPGIIRYIKGLGADVRLESPTVPSDYVLDQNYPNPFNPSTEIRFSLSKSGFTTLRVFDILGRQVAELVAKNLAPGTYRSTFDGAKLSTGTYIYELRSGDTRLVKKMMLLK